MKNKLPQSSLPFSIASLLSTVFNGYQIFSFLLQVANSKHGFSDGVVEVLIKSHVKEANKRL